MLNTYDIMITHCTEILNVLQGNWDNLSKYGLIALEILYTV